MRTPKKRQPELKKQPQPSLVHQLRRREYEERVQRLAMMQPQKIVPKAGGTSGTPKATSLARLHIVYVMVHVGVAGGSKVIFDHANHLQEAGVRVTVLSHYPPPVWYPLLCEYRQAPFQVELAHCIPPCDVIVATYWDHLHACVETGLAPVVYLEQGDFHLFTAVQPNLMRIVQQQFKAPAYVTTVSHRTADLIKTRFGRDAHVFPNAVDPRVFYPKREPRALPTVPTLMMMGSDRITFKGTAEVLKAWRMVREAGHLIDLLWVSPEPLQQPEGRVYIKPVQHLLGELYRSATLFVSASHFEAFSLPPLEAMACGCPVVSTTTAGILEYAENGQNCLLTAIQNPAQLAEQIVKVLTQPALAQQLIRNGLQTAGRFRWDAIAAQLKEFYEEVALFEPATQNSLSDWDISAVAAEWMGSEGPARFERYLDQTAADLIWIPVVYELFEGHQVARWEVAARRCERTTAAEAKLFCAARGHTPNLPYAEAYTHFRAGRYNEAMGLFTQHLTEAQGQDEKAVYTRWVALCLIELERDEEAFTLVKSALKQHPENTDLAYLQGVVQNLTGRPENLSTLLHAIMMVGDCAHYPEFFFEISQLATERLAPSIRPRV